MIPRAGAVAASPPVSNTRINRSLVRRPGSIFYTAQRSRGGEGVRVLVRPGVSCLSLGALWALLPLTAHSSLPLGSAGRPCCLTNAMDRGALMVRGGVNPVHAVSCPCG
jgi:hypothetical protein